jgi:hypothetical protein
MTNEKILIDTNRMFYIPKGRYTMSEDTDYGIWKALYDIKSA